MRLLFFLAAIFVFSCAPRGSRENGSQPVRPVVATQKVTHDSDDPAIWIDPANPANTLIIGTDKGGETGDGGLFVFNLRGERVDSVRPLKRPNNVDVAYGLTLGSRTYDIAVCTERRANAIRVFSLPDLRPLDNGGISVFETEPDTLRDPMGIALYTDPATKQIYAIVGRKSGPRGGTYLWQYLLHESDNGSVTGTVKRKFGFYSGKKEIESIAVDNELGFIYHSDEKHGIHKSYAHPDSSNVELALFGTIGFTSDVEGISIYKTSTTSGFILVSDQQANLFRVFPREGTGAHQHPEIAVIALSTIESDGSDVTSRALPGFEQGLFVAMTDNGTFQFYDWRDIAKRIPAK